MTTLRRRALVSLDRHHEPHARARRLRRRRRARSDASRTGRGSPGQIRFDNDAREHVHVYLIGEKREWLLGRVEPGAMATAADSRRGARRGPGVRAARGARGRAA